MERAVSLESVLAATAVTNPVASRLANCMGRVYTQATMLAPRRLEEPAAESGLGVIPRCAVPDYGKPDVYSK